MTEENKKTELNLEWENRRLCIDESCIGVIGPDGCCKECGKRDADAAIAGDKKAAVKTAPEVTTDDTFDEPAVEDNLPADDVEMTKNETFDDDDWGNRKLCVDESCIGVIGPDGCCKECGKPFQATGPSENI